MDPAITQFLAVLPLPLMILAMLGVPLLLALACGHIIQSIFTPQELAANAVVGATKYGFIVEVYAVVAALTLVGAWDIYQTARDTLQKEVGGLYMLALSVPSYNLPEQGPARGEMYAAIRGYAAVVVESDWENMQSGSGLSESDAAFGRLTRAFFDPEPTTLAQQALAQNTIGWVAQVAEARIARLSVMSRTIGGLIWALILILSVAILAFQWFFGSSTAAVHYAMGGFVALIVGSVLAVSIKLAFPFIGDPALLSARPFLQLMRVE